MDDEFLIIKIPDAFEEASTIHTVSCFICNRYMEYI